MDDYIYYEEQRLGKLMFWISICLIDFFLLFILYNLFSHNVSLILTGLASIVLLMASALDIFLFLVFKLAVKIDFEYLYITLAPIVFIKIPVNEISLTEITAFNRFRDYGGVGTGRAFRGKDPAYFLSGNKGVRIYYPLSKRLIVGAADPQRLINAVVYAQQRKKILSEMN
jgi:hypothetical protein